MNSVNLIGRLTRDPELHVTDDGITICNLRIAVDDTFSRDDRADFISVTVFGAQGKACQEYLKKGFICGVSGRIRSETFVGKDGAKRYPIKVTADRVQFLQWPERKATAPACAAEAQDANGVAKSAGTDAYIPMSTAESLGASLGESVV